MGSLMYQGWTFPVPEDDMESCEGHESPILTISSEENSFDDADRLTAVHPPQLVCRADTAQISIVGFQLLCVQGTLRSNQLTSTQGSSFLPLKGNIQPQVDKSTIHTVLMTTGNNYRLRAQRLARRLMV